MTRGTRPDIIIRDLIQTEATKVLNIINQKQEFAESLINGKELVKTRLMELDHISAPLAGMITTLTAYEETNQDLISETIEQLVNLSRYVDVLFLGNPTKILWIERRDIDTYFTGFRYYPALLLVYGSGIISIARKNFNMLDVILSKPQVHQGFDDNRKRIQYFNILGSCRSLFVDINAVIDLNPEMLKHGRNFYDFLISTFQQLVSEIIPIEQKFLEYLDIFEYFVSLKYIEFFPGESEHLNITNAPDIFKNRIWYSTSQGIGSVTLPRYISEYLNQNRHEIDTYFSLNEGLSDLIRKHKQLLE